MNTPCSLGRVRGQSPSQKHGALPQGLSDSTYTTAAVRASKPRSPGPRPEAMTVHTRHLPVSHAIQCLHLHTCWHTKWTCCVQRNHRHHSGALTGPSEPAVLPLHVCLHTGVTIGMSVLLLPLPVLGPRAPLAGASLCYE